MSTAPITNGDPAQRSDDFDRRVGTLNTLEISPRAVLLTLLIVLVSQAVVILYTVGNTNQLRNVAKTNAGFIKGINDCTDPNGGCYQRERARQEAERQRQVEESNKLVNDALQQIAESQQAALNDALQKSNAENQRQTNQILDALRRVQANQPVPTTTTVPPDTTPVTVPPPTIPLPSSSSPPTTSTTMPPNLLCGLLSILCSSTS